MTATLFALAEDINPRLFDELNAATEHGSTFEDPDGFRVVFVPERWDNLVEALRVPGDAQLHGSAPRSRRRRREKLLDGFQHRIAVVARQTQPVDRARAIHQRRRVAAELSCCRDR